MKSDGIFCFLRENGQKIVFANGSQKLIERARTQGQICHSSYGETDIDVYKIFQQTACCYDIEVWPLLVEVSQQSNCFRRILNLIDENERGAFMLGFTQAGKQHVNQIIQRNIHLE